MKKIFTIVALATVLASCGNRAKEDTLAKQQAIVAVKDSCHLFMIGSLEEWEERRDSKKE